MASSTPQEGCGSGQGGHTNNGVFIRCSCTNCLFWWRWWQKYSLYIFLFGSCSLVIVAAYEIPMGKEDCFLIIFIIVLELAVASEVSLFGSRGITAATAVFCKGYLSARIENNCINADKNAARFLRGRYLMGQDNCLCRRAKDPRVVVSRRQVLLATEVQRSLFSLIGASLN